MNTPNCAKMRHPSSGSGYGPPENIFVPFWNTLQNKIKKI